MDVQADADSPVSARVTAAKAVLELAYKAVQIEDLDSRVVALEKKAQPGAITDQEFLSWTREGFGLAEPS
jgi:hypothetical protein